MTPTSVPYEIVDKLGEGGILFHRERAKRSGRAIPRSRDGSVCILASISRGYVWFSVSPEQKTILYTEFNPLASDVDDGRQSR
jgi:hypothetical protein